MRKEGIQVVGKGAVLSWAARVGEAQAQVATGLRDGRRKRGLGMAESVSPGSARTRQGPNRRRDALLARHRGGGGFLGPAGAGGEAGLRVLLLLLV